jgi:glycosyltransferase involved in cell wall biosynthesis
MRLLVLVSDAFGGWGGIAKFNRDLISALTSHRTAPRVVAIPRRIEGPLDGLPSGVEYRTAASKGKGPFAMAVAATLIQRPRFDAVVCGHINLAPFAWLAGRAHRCPVILNVHGIDAWQPPSRWITAAAAERVDAVVAVSRATLERFRGWARVANALTFVLPNTVDRSHFEPGPKPEDLLDRHGLRGRRILMTLARLDAQERYKGMDEVMGALDELAKVHPNLSYLIAGDGTDRPRLEQEARRLGVADRVVFAGRVPEDRKADYYRMADAFVMPGRGEGFGIVYLEALACGIPVVGSVLDGSRDALLDGRLGTLVNPDDRSDVVRGILEALRRPRGVVPAELEEFSYGRFEQRVHAILDRLIPARSAER